MEDTDSPVRRREEQRVCATPMLPFPQSKTRTGRASCEALGLRKQMEFSNKKNQALRTKLKEIIEIADGVNQESDAMTSGKTLEDMQRIRALALDILVEL